MLQNSKFAVEKVLNRVKEIPGDVKAVGDRIKYNRQEDLADIQRAKIVKDRGYRRMANSTAIDAGNESDPRFRARAVEAMKKYVK